MNERTFGPFEIMRSTPRTPEQIREDLTIEKIDHMGMREGMDTVLGRVRELCDFVAAQVRGRIGDYCAYCGGAMAAGEVRCPGCGARKSK